MVANSGPTDGILYFTDDELRQMKTDLAKAGSLDCFSCDIPLTLLLAFVYRLEAAERIASYGHVDWCDQSDKACECGYEEWRRVSGKATVSNVASQIEK